MTEPKNQHDVVDEVREQEAQRVGERRGAREKQAQIIAAIRSHLTAEENERASDRLIWQAAHDPRIHAEGIRTALAAVETPTQPEQHCGGSGEDGAALIAAERRRQVEQEGWTPEHDAEHDCGELVEAAICYLRPGHHVDTPGDPPPGWPWEKLWWKPSGTEPAEYIRDLAKAGALIAAEIDRVQGRAS